MTESSPLPTTGKDIRDHLRRSLAADLVGPFDQADLNSTEVLPLPPSRWYLTGFLAPELRRDVDDPTEDDELGAGDDSDDEDSQGEEPLPKQRKVFPASLGLSVLLPPGERGPVTARVRWADYVYTEVEPDPARDGERKRKVGVWVRHPRGPIPVEVPLDRERLTAGIPVPGAPGVVLIGTLGDAAGQGLDGGTQALAVFLVNQRSVPEDRKPDESFMFQVELELELAAGFAPRPNRTGERSNDPDEQVADLQYRERYEYVVGHCASAEIPEGTPRVDGRPTRARTCWLPAVEVRRVVTREDPRVETAMDALATLAGADAPARLGPLTELYGAWLEDQAKIPLDSTERENARNGLLQEAENARRRIARGIALLAEDPQVCRAFNLANAAMAMSARRRFGEQTTPRWHLFQLAFLLLNLECIADPKSEHRDDVELIFFPTGGGKTEAYLGVIAFTLLLRRLRGAARPDGGLGVAVLLRYTLRLLTLDQLARASTLVCALELLRRQHPGELGRERLSIGLWVGRSATANTLSEVARRVTEYKNNRAPSPFPLTHCPWCGKDLKPDSMSLYPKATRPEEVRVSCVQPECAFSGRSTRGEGLPILFVDEQIYRELPAFLVATVDKFAMLPWRGDTGMLFGRVTAREGRRFTGPLDGKPGRGAILLPHGVRPPELIVQDELHLISGPLGTMVGLYETAIDVLATDRSQDPPVRPKILASTATVRRARKQIQALFGRRRTNLFPPPGVDAFETWFATVDHDSPGRRYVGVAAPGRAMKAILLRTYVALLGAAAKVYDRTGPEDQPADAYMTVAGYFNSLRELGGMRRLVEDDVRTRCAQAEARVPRDAVGRHPYVRNRDLREPVELTSRESTASIAQAKARLALPHAHDRHVDVLLASNMISVGVDIDRLGLMVVAGQPKTTSEYIQASSRVGRKPK
ncbi:MAG TPA: helicase-related protein, partial [Nannocystis sp.]